MCIETYPAWQGCGHRYMKNPSSYEPCGPNSAAYPCVKPRIYQLRVIGSGLCPTCSIICSGTWADRDETIAMLSDTNMDASIVRDYTELAENLYERAFSLEWQSEGPHHLGAVRFMSTIYPLNDIVKLVIKLKATYPGPTASRFISIAWLATAIHLTRTSQSARWSVSSERKRWMETYHYVLGDEMQSALNDNKPDALLKFSDTLEQGFVNMFNMLTLMEDDGSDSDSSDVTVTPDNFRRGPSDSASSGRQKVTFKFQPPTSSVSSSKMVSLENGKAIARGPSDKLTRKSRTEEAEASTAATSSDWKGKGTAVVPTQISTSEQIQDIKDKSKVEENLKQN